MRRLIAVAAAGVAVGAGLALLTVHLTEPDERRGPSVVDKGFAHDMVVHHQQAVLMATYARQHTASDDVRALAAAIDAAQQREIGQMIGWLQSWDAPMQSDLPAMHWMGSDMASKHHHGDTSSMPGSMPGMATTAEMDKFVNLRGERLDAEFLRLMTRHHEGGLPMAKDAATRARLPYVRDTARLMIQDQQREIDQMRVLMRATQ